MPSLPPDALFLLQNRLQAVDEGRHIYRMPGEHQCWITRIGMNRVFFRDLDPLGLIRSGCPSPAFALWKLCETGNDLFSVIGLGNGQPFIQRYDRILSLLLVKEKTIAEFEDSLIDFLGSLVYQCISQREIPTHARSEEHTSELQSPSF